MKKRILMVLMMLMLFTLAGCSLVTNEIYNKSYNVGEIDIADQQSLIIAAIEKAEGSVLGVVYYEKNALGVTTEAYYGSGFVYKTTAVMKDGSKKTYDEVLDSNNVDYFEYFLLTNRHVIEGKGRRPDIKVYFGDEDKEVDAEVVEYDEKVDLAVLKFRHTTIVKPLEFAKSNQVKKGQYAIAIGSPSGFEFYGSATVGHVSHPQRYIAEDLDDDGKPDWDSEYIQHGVAINPGNSGGPLINLEGKVIGINTMKFVSDEIEGMGFSIPSDLVTKLYPLLEKGIRPSRTLLGLTGEAVNKMTNLEKTAFNLSDNLEKGVYISEIDASGFAYRNGLRKGDVIVEFDEVEVLNARDVRVILNTIFMDQGKVIDVSIIRNGTAMTISLNFRSQR